MQWDPQETTGEAVLKMSWKYPEFSGTVIATNNSGDYGEPLKCSRNENGRPAIIGSNC